jgi:electron transport complex protein RnfC
MREYLPRRRECGGLRIPANKEASTTQAILRNFIPSKLILSLRQHRGPAAEPVVAIGERVLKGQVVGKSADSSWVHASSSGYVSAIEPRAVPSFVATGTETCVVVDCDGLDETFPADNHWPAEHSAQRERMRQAGIVGLGGAIYPTDLKLAGRQNATLVINGAECEPYISCDDMLMREAAGAILEGARIMCRMIGAANCILAIERDKPVAIEAAHAAAEQIDFDELKIAELPSVYPAGGERQLIQVLSGIEVPPDAYPDSIGYLCQNVGTAYAVQRLARFGEPLISRIVTVTGGALERAANIEVPIGTAVAELVAICGGYASPPARLIHGGSMMGYALPDDALPVTKSSNCLIAASAEEVRQDYREWPCIRCGECSIACPVRLLPQDLLIAARSNDVPWLNTLGITDCIECGCCDVICPSHIPLTQMFREAKAVVREQRSRDVFSFESERRYQQRNQRRQDEDTHSREHQAALIRNVTAGAQADKSAAVLAAVERARRRKLDSDDS